MNESGLWKNMIYVISKYQNFREVKGMYENEKKNDQANIYGLVKARVVYK